DDRRQRRRIDVLQRVGVLVPTNQLVRFRRRQLRRHAGRRRRRQRERTIDVLVELLHLHGQLVERLLVTGRRERIVGNVVRQLRQRHVAQDRQRHVRRRRYAQRDRAARRIASTRDRVVRTQYQRDSGD